MSSPTGVNLADPEFEPTDAQLVGLSQRAFAGVAEAHQAALRRLRGEIAEARAAVLARLAKDRPTSRGEPI
jgi:hypothetical protein